MLICLGIFVFETRSVPYQQLKRATEWRHASLSCVGDHLAYQFIGQGSDTITLSGTLLPEFTGGRLDLDEIRDMADRGRWSGARAGNMAYG